ncbi:MAG: metalloregulator ArsR/SmtB family transcription factor [Alphaproteobacteria bacterium]|nr:metalloregulator ArsR/SmtB family transcription factor [Alphaproteobacteria bacterium]
MNIETLMKGVGPAERLLKLMANRHRLMILCALGEGEKSVGAICDLIGLGQSAVSQHLARMRADGLVRPRREAQTVYYALASGEAAAVIDLLERLYCAAPAAPRTETP